MDVREYLTRERERERERECEIERVSEKSVCACVKETWTTHGKVEKKRVCLMQTYHTCIFDSGSEGEEIVCGCLQQRERPLACGQERSDKQGREVERDVWRKCRHGEERVYVCDREIPWRS